MELCLSASRLISILLECVAGGKYEQVQREASSTMEQEKLAAAPLCGKHHHTPRNQNKDTEGERLTGLRKLLFFPPFYFATINSTENISSTQQVY